MPLCGLDLSLRREWIVAVGILLPYSSVRSVDNYLGTIVDCDSSSNLNGFLLGRNNSSSLLVACALDLPIVSVRGNVLIFGHRKPPYP